MPQHHNIDFFYILCYDYLILFFLFLTSKFKSLQAFHTFSRRFSMIKIVFTHFAPHLEELIAYLVFLLHQGKKFSKAADLKLQYLLNANELPGLPTGVKFSECLFLGIADKLRSQLVATAVPLEQIVDEHDGAGRNADSSFRKLLALLGLNENKFLNNWADALGFKDSGKGGDNFTFYRTLDAAYDEEKLRGGCNEGVAWALEIAQAALECDDYFVKGERAERAGNFFERLACVWACYRSKTLNKEEALDKFFFSGWQKKPASITETLKKLGKLEDGKLSQIIRMAEKTSLRSRGPLGLPRMLLAHCEKHGLERTIEAAFKAFDVERLKQKNFILAEEIVKNSKWISLSDARSFALIVDSDNPEINPAARYYFGEKVGVIIQEESHPKKSMHIFTNAITGASLSAFFQAILAEEKRLEDKFGKASVEKWHLLVGKTHIVLNGSTSYPGVPSTLIPLSWFEQNVARLVDFPQSQTQNQAA